MIKYTHFQSLPQGRGPSNTACYRAVFSVVLDPQPGLSHGSDARLQEQFGFLTDVSKAYLRPVTCTLLEQLGVSTQLT